MTRRKSELLEKVPSPQETAKSGGMGATGVGRHDGDIEADSESTEIWKRGTEWVSQLDKRFAVCAAKQWE